MNRRKTGKRLTAAVLAALLSASPLAAFGADESGGNTFTFSDVTGGWYLNYIDTLNKAGLISGYADGTFRPNNTMTVAEYVALTVYAVSKKPQLREKLETEHWAMPLCSYAEQIGLFTKGDGFEEKLDQPIKREDMAYLLVNAAAQKQETLTALKNVRYKIADYSGISANRRDAVEKIYSSGIMNGNRGKINPQASATRAEAATVFVKLLDKEERSAVSIAPIEFTGAAMNAAQARAEAARMVKVLKPEIQEIRKIVDNWVYVSNLGMHYFIHTAPSKAQLEYEIAKAQQYTDTTELEKELADLKAVMELKSNALDAIDEVVYDRGFLCLELEGRLEAESENMKTFSGGEDTYALQLLKAETEAALAKVKSEDARIQSLLEKAGGF